ncbi:MAG: PAS domain-containing protein [Candidatus Kapaibacterium sp.]
MNTSLVLDEHQLNRLFPFYIRIDRQLRILDAGASLRKLYAIEPGTLFSSLFSFQRPYHVISSFDDIRDLAYQLVVIQHLDGSVLKGQFEPVSDGDVMMFVGSPWYNSIEQITDAGLLLSDFAPHDHTVDFLHILTMQKNVNEDIRQLLETVSEQKNALKRLSMITQRTQNAVIITDKHGAIEWVNEAFTEISGYKLPEVITKKPGDILQGPETDLETVRYMHNQIKHLETFSCEVINYRKDGTPYWVRIQAQPIFDLQGNLTQYFAIEEDISDSKRMMIDIKTTNARLRTLVGNLSDGVLLENEHRIIEIINNRFCELFGIPVSPEVLVGTDCSQAAEQAKGLFVNEQEFVERVETLLRERVQVFGDELELKDGRWFDRDFIPIFQEDTYLGHLWVYTDITDRKRYNSTLRQQREFYENILNKIPSDIAVFDNEHHYLFVNPIGIKNKELREWIIGKTDYDYCEYRNRPIAIADGRRALYNAVMESKELKIWEEEVVRPDGEKDIFLRYMYPVLDEKSNVTMLIGYGINITDRKKAEKEIADALSRQQELNELKSRFVSMISHEFRTPLSTILSSAQLLEKYWDTFTEEKRKKHFPKIEIAVSRMTALLDDVLFIGRTDSNKAVFSPKLLNIKSYCLDVIEEVSMSGYGTDRVDFEFEGTGEEVLADDKLLRHILVNLLSNALKYSPKSEQVDFTVHTMAESMRFQVRDRGIGIPADDQTRLFEVFHRASNVGTVHGTGLGLSIVKRSVDIHGGTITVESTEGAGTTFTVELPSTSTGGTTAAR